MNRIGKGGLVARLTISRSRLAAAAAAAAALSTLLSLVLQTLIKERQMDITLYRVPASSYSRWASYMVSTVHTGYGHMSFVGAHSHPLYMMLYQLCKYICIYETRLAHQNTSLLIGTCILFLSFVFVVLCLAAI